jgi:tetratricopeptide (TPR) repeat protein
MDPNMVGTRMKVVAGLYYQSKNYPKAAEWGEKAAAQLNDPDLQTLAGQAYYLNKQFKESADNMAKAIKMVEAKGETPKEEWIQLYMSAEFEQKDTAGVEASLEEMVQYYPKPKYWEDFLSIVQRNFKDSNRSSLDIYRLMFTTGALTKPEEFAEMADIAVREGNPGLAKTVVEKGFASGILGVGARKAQDAALKQKVEAAVASDKKDFAAGEAQAKAQKTGDNDVKFGIAYAGYGQTDKAIEAIQRGIAKGVKDKDDAQLRLGIAYIDAGQRPQALETFKQITPGTPKARLAHLWTLATASHAAPAAAQ